MAKRQDYYYIRLIATAFCFGLFGLGGLALRLLVLPAISLFYRNSTQRTLVSRLTVHYCFKLFIGIMHKCGIFTYSLRGEDLLNQPGRLIIANHPSLIDIVFLISLVKNANCIIKSSLVNNPFMRGPILNAGYIPNEPAEAIPELCTTALKQGESLIIFPEGTRSQPNIPIKLHRSAAYLALVTHAKVTLVDINCSPTMLTKKDKWYQIPYNRPHFDIRVQNDISLPSADSCGGYISKQTRLLTRQWEERFNMESIQ